MCQCCRGSTFYHPELAFSIDFPDGWRTVNQRAQVGAVSPNQDAVVVLSLAGGNSAEAAARDFFNQQGVRSGQARAANLNGLQAVSGPFQVSQAQGAPDIVGIAAFVEHRDQVYRVLGYTTQTRWNQHGGALDRALESFDRVTDRRVLDVQPARLDVVRIPNEMTLREFQQRYASSADLETLALINQVSADARLPAGLEVKRVVGGELPR